MTLPMLGMNSRMNAMKPKNKARLIDRNSKMIQVQAPTPNAIRLCTYVFRVGGWGGYLVNNTNG